MPNTLQTTEFTTEVTVAAGASGTAKLTWAKIEVAAAEDEAMALAGRPEIAEFTAETIGARLAADDERLDEAARRAELALAAEAELAEAKLAEATEAELALATEAKLALATEAELALATEAELALATEAELALATEAELALATEAELALATEAELALATEAELALATEAELALATEAELTLATEAELALAAEAELALAAEAEFTPVEAATLVVVPQLLKRPTPRTLQTTPFKALVTVATAAELDEVAVEDKLEDRDEVELPTTTVESPELEVELKLLDATRELETDTAAHTP